MRLFHFYLFYFILLGCLPLTTSAETLAFIFQKQGIQRDNFIGVYEFSPGIDAQIAKGAELMRQYSIIQIPTFVIDNVYQTDLAMANGDPKELMKIINYLIAQAALQKTKK